MPEVWWINNDMLVKLENLRTSTMSTGSYLNNSTNLKVNVWKALSTGTPADRVVTNRLMSYVAATNGNYRTVIQSTDHTMSIGVTGLAIISLAHLGLNAEWRVPFRVDPRRTS